MGWAADARNAQMPEVEKELLGLATAAEWERWKSVQSATTNVVLEDLHIDYTLH